ncbi:hypothetical protein MPH_10124 [Macrophomina phaseolina MS6]|uniref:DUF7888 domain-containing protein n=1 Tax=Macrophomina phaseolina (strain MS6) TaxID=1126212 RepID=K2RDS9_MACPH|nr:hypothetical protein MPH_10124 [Macrophomina phaseolina MS6]
MRFSTAVIAAAAVASAAAAPAVGTAPLDVAVVESNNEPRAAAAAEVVQWDGVPADPELVVDITTEKAIEKRAIPAVVIAAGSAMGSAALGDLTTRAINAAVGLIGNIANWNAARERFTRTTTAEMWKRNPDYNRWKAAVCYNMAYDVRDRNNVAGFKDANFKLGALSTDYDCMYLGRGNAFWTRGDGGYINLSYTYQRGACTFDGRTGDLTC